MNEVGGISVKLKADFDDSGLVTAMANVKQATKGVGDQLKQTDAQLKNSQGMFGRFADNLKRKVSGVTKSFKIQKNASAQMGMQLQDVAVMAQYGADKMVILGQQGSQIASLFGPGGAMLGALIAVGSAIAGVAFKMNAAAKETENLDQKLRSLSEQSALTAAEQEYLNELDKKSNAEKQKRVKTIEKEIKAEQDRLAAMKSAGEGLDTGDYAVPRTAQQNQERYATSIAETTSKVVKLRAELSFLNKAISGDRAPKEGKEDYSTDRLDRIKQAVADEAKLFEQLNLVKSNIETGFVTERQAALELELVKDRDRINRKLRATEEGLAKEREQILASESLTAEQKQQLLADIAKTEEDAREMHFQKAMEQGKTYQQAMTDLEKSEAEKRKKIADDEMKAKFNVASNIMSNLSTLMNTESRKMFEVGKAAALAGAVVDGIAAVQGAYKVGAKVGGPVMGAAFAASAGIATAAQIQQIASTKFGSAGTGQSINNGQVVNNTGAGVGPTEPNRNISIALTGSSFSGGDIRNLIGAINDELGDGVALNINGG